MALPRIKRFCLTAFAVLFLLFAGCAGKTSSSSKEGKEHLYSDKLFFWEVKSPSTAVYLLGSIHFAKEEIYPLDPVIEDAFKISENLVVEINMSRENEAVVAAEMVTKATYPRGDSLSNHLSKDVKAVFNTYLKEKGVPEGSLDMFKPWFIAMNLTVQEVQRAGFKPENGIDRYFIKGAGEKNILELESAQQQLDLLDGMPDALQGLFLKSTLLEMGKIQEQMEGLFTAWTNGDTGSMEQLISSTFSEYEELDPIYDMMFTERNIKMADKIEEYLKTKSSYFIVVGAGHLVGQEGIVSLLRQKGFQVEQLRRQRTDRKLKQSKGNVK